MPRAALAPRLFIATALLIFFSSNASAELFISEYIEGSSNNKAIEIYNPDGATVDLGTGSYQLLFYFNGSATAGLTLDLVGTLASGEVHVFANSAANAAILAQADQTNGAGWFNGDDAVVLARNGTVIDAIGQVGFDPGTEWGTGDASTGNNTLRRKPAVCAGDSNAADVFDPATEWDGFAQDTTDGLGSHTSDCLGPPTPLINEFLANITGTDTIEYVEVIGPPSTDFGSYTVLEIEGDGAGAGTIDEVIALGTTDANGFYLASLAASALENGTITLLLVEGFSGALSDDLDTDNDGVLDSTPWTTLIDAVAVNDGGAGDLNYGVPVLGPNYDGISFTPGGASRIPDGLDTDAATDWVRNDFDGAGLPGYTGTLDPGEALNTPGASNAVTPPPPPFTCGEPATLISAVQGPGSASPLVGQEVDVEAVVTAVFQGAGTLGGLFLQEEDADADGDPATSEGLFAFTNEPAQVGDQVRVRGTVVEFFDLTELSPVSDLAVCSSGNAAPTPAAVTLPAATLDDFEAVENMAVQLPDGLVVNELFTLWRFGEFTVSSQRLFQPTAIAEPGAPALAVAAANALDQLLVDDGRTAQNLPVSHTGQDDVNPFSAANPIRNGQAVNGLAGVMHYAFGAYRLQPTGPFVIDEADNPRTAAPALPGGTLKVASLNVLNYFTTLGSRGASTANELARQTAKLVDALAAMDADIVGLIELENDDGTALQALVDALNAVVGAGTYAMLDTGVIGGDEIRQGLVYKPARVTPEGAFAVLDSTVDARFIDSYNRPSLAQTFRAVDNLAPLTVVVSHLKSKGSDCNALGDPDTGDGQGNCNVTRTQAAEALADWIAADPTGAGTANVISLGDLNAYAMEDPIDALQAAGLVDLVAAFEGAAYSFNFDAQAGSLDYAFATPDLQTQVAGATAWHINADEAVALDYNEEFGKPAEYYAPDAYRASDHDPILVALDLDPPSELTIPTTDPNVDATITISGDGASCGFSSAEFVDPAGLSPAPPSNLAFPYGVLRFTAERCDTGATVDIDVAVPQLTDYLAWYKLIGGAWQVYPASWTGSGYRFQVTDGGAGDADGAADGRISDPSGPAFASSTRAGFLVSKAFSDGNPGPVEVSIRCNTGLPLSQDFTLDAGDSVQFVVTSFEPGALDCVISEVPVTGYTAAYAASLGDLGIAAAVSGGADNCAFSGVEDGLLRCDISNTLETVEIVVRKQWLDPELGDRNGPDAHVTLYCDGSNEPAGEAWINADAPGIFSVLPHWQGETCRVEEDPVDGYETDAGDCQVLAISPGAGAECTVVNARFYEGIPALDGRGLLLLVLLMLGGGAVALRRLH